MTSATAAPAAAHHNYRIFDFKDRLNSLITAALSFLIFLPISFRGQFALYFAPQSIISMTMGNRSKPFCVRLYTNFDLFAGDTSFTSIFSASRTFSLLTRIFEAIFSSEPKN